MIAIFVKGHIEEAELPQFFLAVSKHGLVGGIGRKKLALQVGQRNADDRVLKNRPPALFATRELSVCLMQRVLIQPQFFSSGVSSFAASLGICLLLGHLVGARIV